MSAHISFCCNPSGNLSSIITILHISFIHNLSRIFQKNYKSENQKKGQKFPHGSKASILLYLDNRKNVGRINKKKKWKNIMFLLLTLYTLQNSTDSSLYAIYNIKNKYDRRWHNFLIKWNHLTWITNQDFVTTK